MSNPKNSGQKGWLSRLLFWGVSFSVLVVLLALWIPLPWIASKIPLLSDESIESFRALHSKWLVYVSALIAVMWLLVVVAVRWQFIEKLKTCWQQANDLCQWLKKQCRRFRSVLKEEREWSPAEIKRLQKDFMASYRWSVKWCRENPWWKVGLTVFATGIVAWMAMRFILNFKIPLEVYWTGIVLITLAGATAGFTYWRGRQADKQIKETQRQARFQSFDKIIQMAVDNENSARALAGWRRIEMWFSHEQGGLEKSEDRRDREDWGKFLEIARHTAQSVLDLKPETKAVFDEELKRYEDAEQPDGFVPWQEVRKDYFAESDKTRVSESVRQRALNFLMENFGRGNSDDRVLLTEYDLSGLQLVSDLLRPRYPGKKPQIYARLSHCMGMRAVWGTDLSNSNFEYAKMLGARLKRANLNGADLSRADLRHADLEGADLRKADLSYADLRKAQILRYLPSLAPLSSLLSPSVTALFSDQPARTVYSSACFHETKIDEADFTEIEGIYPIDLQALLMGCYWDKTDEYSKPFLPEGVDANDIPGSAEETREMGGDGWQPPKLPPYPPSPPTPPFLTGLGGLGGGFYPR